jgi:hypothetical protein
LDLLAGEMVRLTSHETLSGDTVGRRLAEMTLKPWQEKMWCIPTVNTEFVARMEDVLALYAEPPAPLRPVVCFDETPRQLIGEERVPIRAEPGKPRRYDYEYVRNGTANVFMFVDVNRPWRHAKVTDQRTCIDFAECMRDLVDEHYPEAERILVPAGTAVLGNSTAQGFVTQVVTARLNVIAVPALAVLAWNAWRSGGPRLWTTWAVMVAAQIVLFVLHPQLDALLDTGARRVLDHATFYAWHRAYLLVTAAQWLAALAHAVVASGAWRSEDLSAPR